MRTTRRRVSLGVLLAVATVPALVATGGSAVLADPTSTSAPPPAPSATVPGDLNGVPAAALERMRREAPLVAAAERITAAAGRLPGYSGVALIGGGSRVTVYWKGTPATAVLREQAGKVPVAVEPARFSRAELETAAGQVSRGLARLRDRASVGFPVTGAGITVQTGDVAAARRQLPDIAVPVTVEKAAPAPAPAKTAARAAAAGVRPPSPSRQDDAPSAWGGAHWVNGNATGGNDGSQTRDDHGMVVSADQKYHCTSGFPMLDQRAAQGVELMLGAASCGGPRHLFTDPTGAAVNAPLDGCDCWQNTTYGVTLTKPVGGAEPFVYTDGSWSEIGWSVQRWSSFVAGQHVCISGAHTGVMCDAVVTDSIGTKSAWVSDSQGGSTEVVKLTSISMSGGTRPYTLMDGSSCGLLDPGGQLPGEEQECWDPAVGPGDIGAPIFTVDGAEFTGVTLRGILIRRQLGPDSNENAFWVDAQSVGNVMTAFQETFGFGLNILHQGNDIP